MSLTAHDTARILRATLDNARSGNTTIAWLPRFPQRCCNFAANLLLLELADAGFTRLRRMMGTVQDPRGDDLAAHVWVQAGDLTVDITADQYGQPDVIVEPNSNWHLLLADVRPFVPRSDLPDGVPEVEIARLREIYEDVLRELAPFR